MALTLQPSRPCTVAPSPPWPHFPPLSTPATLASSMVPRNSKLFLAWAFAQAVLCPEHFLHDFFLLILQISAQKTFSSHPGEMKLDAIPEVTSPGNLLVSFKVNVTVHNDMLDSLPTLLLSVSPTGLGVLGEQGSCLP